MPKKTDRVREPSEEERVQGTYIGLWIGGGRGMPSEIISGASHSTLLRCKQNGALQWRFPIYLLFKSELIITDLGQAEVLRIRRTKGFVAYFEILQNNQQVGTICYHSVWRTRCTIALAGGIRWEMRQPLFTIYFWGESNTGECIWIRVGPTKRQWNLLVPASGVDTRLLAALALMHREYWTH